MIDPFSFGASAVCGAAAAYAIHQNRRHLSIIKEEIQSLLNECFFLQNCLQVNVWREREQHQRGLASSSRLDRSAIVPNDDALLDASVKLRDLHCFISYITRAAQQSNRRDHWEWIRNSDNIDRLRAELRSIRKDLIVRCRNASTRNSNDEPFVIKIDRRESEVFGQAIQPTQQQSVRFNLHRAKIEDRLASHEIWSQVYQEYQQAEWMSAYRQATLPAYRQKPRVHAIQASNHSEPITRPIVQDSSSFWLEALPCSCIGRRQPSSLAIALKLVTTCSSIRTCYVLVALGMISIAGSLALALWRTINNSDIQGGFSIAQYVLAVGALIIGCVLVIHSRTCSCWSSSSCTGGNGTAPEHSPIELQHPRYSESSARRVLMLAAR